METRPQIIELFPSPDHRWEHNSLEATRKQNKAIAQLRDQVIQQNGKLNALVHGWYTRHSPNFLNPDYKATDYYYAARDELLQSSLENNEPVVIFEPGFWANLLPYKLEGLNGTVYAIYTRSDDPAPLNDNVTTRSDWMGLFRVFHEAKVNTINLGGLILDLQQVTDDHQTMVSFPQGGEAEPRYIHIMDARLELERYAEELSRARGCVIQDLCAYQWLRHGFVPTGCVGFTAAVFLQAGFDVSLSTVSSHEDEVAPGFKNVFPKEWYKSDLKP